MKKFILLILLLVAISGVTASSDIVTWGGQYHIGPVFPTGDFPFIFKVYDAPTGGVMCYSNTLMLATDYGAWTTEQSGVSAACSDATKDYYLEINIDGQDQPPRRRLSMFSFPRNDVSTGQLKAIIDWSNIIGKSIPTSMPWNNITNRPSIPTSFSWLTNITDKPNITADTNCSVDNSCPLITYDSETTGWDKNAADDITTSGGTINGDLNINGNLQIIGSVLNATVTNQYLNGSFLPSISELFNLGSPDLRWGMIYGTINWSDVANKPTVINGIDGKNGTDGAQGPQGLQGIQGEKGTDGSQGQQGIAGTNGTNGLDGTNGTNGIDAITNNISSITWDSGNFTITWTNGQSFTSPNLTGPKGEQGIQGIQGEPGSNGIDGRNGTDGLNGTNGLDGINGADGINGTNANLLGYQPWLYNDSQNMILNVSRLNVEFANHSDLTSGGSGNVSSNNGTAGYLALWENATRLNTSSIYQTPLGDIGFGTTTPAGHVDIPNNFNPDTNAILRNGQDDNEVQAVNIEGGIADPYLNVGRCQNFILQTEAFDTTWVKVNVSVVANAQISPINTLIAENLTGNATGTPMLYQALVNNTAANFTFSLWMRLKQGNGVIGLQVNTNTSTGLINGTIKNVTIDSKWKRYYVSDEVLVGANRTVYIYPGNNNISLWGAQLEFGKFPEAYCGAQTTTATHGFTTGIRTPVGISTGGTLTTTGISSSGSCGCTGVAAGGAVSGVTTLAMTGALSGGTTNSWSSTSTNTIAAAFISQDGVIETSTTAATVAAPIQYSPRLRLSGTVWDFGAGASRTINWKQEAVPIVGSGNAGDNSTSRLVWGYGYNDVTNNGLTERMILSSEGILDVVGTTFGAEVLNGGRNVTLANWTATGGFNLTTPGTIANYTFAKGASGLLWQNVQNFTAPANVNRWYMFDYSLRDYVAGCSAYITPSFANKFIYLPGVSSGNGAYHIAFKANQSITNFTLNVTCTAGSISFANMSLTEYQSGDIVANGQVTGGGTTGLKIDGNGTIAVTGMLNLNRSTYPACTVIQEGWMVFNSTAKKFYGCNSTAWVPWDNAI